MKRQIAWFMAALMCVTSVPQGSLVSKAAEETEISTEAITETSSDEEVVETAETGEAVENVETAAETAAESEIVEIPVPDTEQQSTEIIETETETATIESAESETAFSETNESETADTEENSEPIEEDTEVPETLAPEKVDLETESEEKIAEQIAVLEDDDDDFDEDDDNDVRKISTITLSKDYTTYLYGLENDYTNYLKIDLTYEDSDEIETIILSGLRKYAYDKYDNELDISYLDALGNEVEWDEIGKGTYKIHVEDFSDSDVYGELEFTVADPEEIVTNSLSLGNKINLNISKEKRIWYKYSVPRDGKYLLKFQANGEMDIFVGDDSYNYKWDNFEKEEYLEAGATYYFRVNASNDEKFKGSVELQAAPRENSEKVTAITSIKLNKYYKPMLEGQTYISTSDLEFTVCYEDGSTQTVKGLGADNVFSAHLWNTADEKTIYDLKDGVDPEAGTYILEVFICYGDEKISATSSFTVYNMKDLADKNCVFADTAKIFDMEKDESLLIFKYTATENGTWKVDFNRDFNSLEVVDEAGEKIPLTLGNAFCTMQLNAGETAYFIAKLYESGKRIRVNITKIVSIENVTLGCYYTVEHPYYSNWDLLWSRDFYLDVTYSDGTTSRFSGDDYDKYGNEFITCVVRNGMNFYLDKNGGRLVDGADQVKTYCYYTNGKFQEVASMWIPCKELDGNVLETLPEIKVGKTVRSSNSDSFQYYRFVPEKDGYYSLGYYNQGYYSKAGAYNFYERKENDWEKKGSESVWLEKGKSYLLQIRYNEEFTVLQADDMIQGGILALDQPADITIKDSAKKINFTFTSENEETYQLKIKTVSGGKVHLYVKEYEGPSYSKVVYNRLVASEEEVLLSVKEQEYGYYYDISVEYEEGIGSGSLTISRPTVKTITSMSLLCSEEGPLWGVNGISSVANIAENLYVSLTYEDGISDTISLSNYWDQLFDGGIIEDSYGRQYTVKIEKTATAEEGETHYQFQLVYGDLTASRELILVDPQQKQDITEADGKQITVTQTDGSIAMKVFRFVPSEDGRYRINTNMNGNEKVSVRVKNDGYNVARDFTYDAYKMEKGEEYFIALTFHQSSAGTIDVSVSNVSGKEIVDMELVSLPEDLYTVEEFWYPDLSGAKLKLICQDGTEEIRTFAYGEGIDVNVKAVGGNTCRISFDADGYVVKKDIPMLQKKDLPVLDNGKLENVRFTEQDTDSARTRIVRFNVCTDGVYQVSVMNQNGAEDYQSLVVQEESAKMGETWNPDKNGYELKSGKTYFLIIKAKGTYNISVKNIETGRDHQYEWVTVKNPNCTENGSRKEVCQFCGAEGRTEIIAAKGHTFVTKTDREATCGVAGSQHEECSVCGETKAAVAIPATGNHKYTVKVDKAATCGVAGSQHEECSVCGETKAAVAIPATGNHKYAMKVDKAATCGTAGSQHEECSVCGETKAAVAIPATGNHKYTMKVDKAATCGAAGSQHEECSVCGKKKTATAIPATGKHSFGAYKTVTAATVLKAGSKARTCSVCGKKETAAVARLRATIKLSASRIIVPLKKTIAGPTVTFGKGDAIRSWKSAKTSVVTVNAKTGKLTGKRVGTAKVTVTLKSGKKATVTVYVKKIITTTKLKANRTAVVLRKGKSFQLKVTVTPKNSQEKVTYKSSDSKVAAVTTKGKIIARKKGKAVITITSGTKKITCRVTVK